MKRLLLLCLPLVFAACDSSTDECDGLADCLPPPEGVIVGNQGNFSAGDGSVTVYDPTGDTASEPIRYKGSSIIQSVAASGLELYVAASTGGRIDIYPFGTEGGLGSERSGSVEVANPRYIAFGEDGLLWVTSQLYDRPSEVVVVDPGAVEVVGTVEVGGFAEGIVRVNGRVFVATGTFSATQEVVVIDTATRAVVQRIDVGCTAPRSLLADADGEVWVFCAGSAEAEGEVVVLDAADGAEVTRIDAGGRIDTAGPGQDAYGPVGVTLFAVRDQDTVLRFETGSNTLVGTIPVEGDPIGAVAYDGPRERLYLGRVPGFDVAGSVTIHEPDGTPVGQFTAGAAPTSIVLNTTVNLQP